MKPTIQAAGEAVPDPLYPIFQVATKLDEPLSVLKDLIDAISLICAHDDMPEPFNLTIQRLSWLVKDKIGDIDDVYGSLFKLTHPNRSQLEKAGWPSKGGNANG